MIVRDFVLIPGQVQRPQAAGEEAGSIAQEYTPSGCAEAGRTRSPSSPLQERHQGEPMRDFDVYLSLIILHLE